jgi:hypothetical protein
VREVDGGTHDHRVLAVVTADGAELVQYPRLAGPIRFAVAFLDRFQIGLSLVLAHDR